MAPLFTVIVVAIIGVISLLIFSVWGIPVVVLSILIGAAYLLFARRGSGPSVGAFERGKRIEPTGRPRKASGGADTANERVGHP